MLTSHRVLHDLGLLDLLRAFRDGCGACGAALRPRALACVACGAPTYAGEEMFRRARLDILIAARRGDIPPTLRADVEAAANASRRRATMTRLGQDLDEVSRHCSMGQGDPDALADCIAFLRDVAAQRTTLFDPAALGRAADEVSRHGAMGEGDADALAHCITFLRDLIAGCGGAS